MTTPDSRDNKKVTGPTDPQPPTPQPPPAPEPPSRPPQPAPNPPTPGPTPHPNPGSNPSMSRRAAGWHHGNTLLFVAVAAFAAWMQWPMLKGSFYRATGAAAPASIDWRTDLDAAIAEARSTDRLVLADFSADWCPPCVVMKHDTWPDDEVRAIVSASYVPVLVDPDRNDEAAARYGIDAIPAVLIIDGSGVIVARAGYLPASGMRRFLAERR